MLSIGIATTMCNPRPFTLLAVLGLASVNIADGLKLSQRASRHADRFRSAVRSAVEAGNREEVRENAAALHKKELIGANSKASDADRIAARQKDAILKAINRAHKGGKPGPPKLAPLSTLLSSEVPSAQTPLVLSRTTSASSSPSDGGAQNILGELDIQKFERELDKTLKRFAAELKESESERARGTIGEDMISEVQGLIGRLHDLAKHHLELLRIIQELMLKHGLSYYEGKMLGDIYIPPPTFKSEVEILWNKEGVYRKV
jgi:hypothetical protein